MAIMQGKKKTPPEIPLTSTSDVAFLLLVFFLVAASNAVDKGRPLDLPQTSKQATTQKSQNIEVGIPGNGKVTVSGEAIKNEDELRKILEAKLKGVHDPSLRVVIVTADASVTYQRWTKVVTAVELAGGILAPQMEEDLKKEGEVVTQPAGGAGGGGR